MKWFLFVISCLGIVANVDAGLGKTRSLMLSDGDVGEVRSAVGYSTILQFDTRPSSVVLGDQDAFKVEYVGEGLTVKPLMPGAKTNLFVFTDYDRFNFRVLATNADQADYLVKVSRKRLKSYPLQADPGIPSDSHEKEIGKIAQCGPVSLKLEKMGTSTSEKYLVLTFKLSYAGLRSGQDLGFSPGDVELIQSKKMVPIENLYLDGLSFSRSQPKVAGTMIVKRTEFLPAAPLIVGFSASFLKQPKCLRASFQPVK